jgi:predicted acylesterase/phospholipase RssA
LTDREQELTPEFVPEEEVMRDAGTSRPSPPSGAVPSRARPRAAIILAGAAAKGPYAAGALAAIADADLDVRIVVGTSSGALNAAVYAAGLRAGRTREAAQLLCDLWREKANFFDVFPMKRRTAIVRDALLRFASDPTRNEKVQARVIVTSLPGIKGKYGYVRAEHVYALGAKTLADRHAIPEIADICVASAAIPLLFAPVVLRETGATWDGGIVNNTPLGWALKADPEIDHLVVVTPEPLVDTPAAVTRANGQPLPELASDAHYGRFAIGRLVNIVIEERLNRDLHEARSFNDDIQRLVDLGVSAETLRSKLQWRRLEIIEARPAKPLEGGFLSGFFSPERRARYIELGRDAAKLALASYCARRDDAAAMSAE